MNKRAFVCLAIAASPGIQTGRRAPATNAPTAQAPAMANRGVAGAAQ